MSLLVAAALAVSASTLPACSWDRPGVDPFMGNVVTAVDRYGDIPAPVRAVLKQRMAARQYDDIAVIRRDTITGKHRYSPEIRDMHFGQGQVCRTVTRTQWQPASEERGLVYCESGHCVIVPTVCRNVSRVTRLPPDRNAAAAAEEGPGAGDAPAGGGGAVPMASATPAAMPATETPNGELAFEAPAAGPSFAQQADPAQPAQAVSTLPSLGATAGGTPLDDAGQLLGGGVSGDTLVASGPGGPRGGGGWSPESVGSAPSGASPWLPGSGNGSGSGASPRPGGSAFPFDPTPNPGPLLPPLPAPPVTAVPEPGTWALWLLGLAALAGAARRGRGFRS